MLESIRRNHITDVVWASRWTLLINGDVAGTPLVLEPPSGMTKEAY